MDKHKPFEYIEGPLEPPNQPTIPKGTSGYYDERNDEFIADDEAFEAALEDWDLMSREKQKEFKQFLIDLFFEDWERIRGES